MGYRIFPSGFFITTSIMEIVEIMGHRMGISHSVHIYIYGLYPLVNVYIAIENGHRNSGFTNEKW